MPDQITDKTWRLFFKELIMNFLTAVFKQPIFIILFIVAVTPGIKACFKVDDVEGKANAAEGKAAAAVSAADEAVKQAGNKDLEQASYEVLSNAIGDLQDQTDAMRACLAVEVTPPPVVPVAIRPRPVPVLPTTSATIAPSVEPPAPPPPLPVISYRPAPPKWDDLKIQVESTK